MFQISAKTEYGLQLMLALAEFHGKRRLSLREIAKKRNLPYPFLSGIASQLKKAKLIEPKEGAAGGYHLTRVPSKITAGDVIQAIEGDFSIVRCQQDDKYECPNNEFCTLPPLWNKVSERLYHTFHALTLAELLHQPKKALAKV